MKLMCCRNLLACPLAASGMAGLTDRSLDAATNNFNTTHDALVGIAVTSHKAGTKTQIVLDDIRLER